MQGTQAWGIAYYLTVKCRIYWSNEIWIGVFITKNGFKKRLVQAADLSWDIAYSIETENERQVFKTHKSRKQKQQ
jgi:hypothetical protein